MSTSFPLTCMFLYMAMPLVFTRIILFKEIVERLLSLQSRIDNFELFQPGRELLMEGELGKAFIN